MSTELTLEMKEILTPKKFISICGLKPLSVLIYEETESGSQIFKESENVTLFIASFLGLPLTFNLVARDFWLPVHLDEKGLALLNKNLLSKLGEHNEGVVIQRCQEKRGQKRKKIL